MKVDDIFWPPQDDAEELLYEIRNGHSIEYVKAKSAELKDLWISRSAALKRLHNVRNYLEARIVDYRSVPTLGAVSEADYQRQLGRLDTYKEILSVFLGDETPADDIYPALEDVLAKHARGWNSRPTTKSNIVALIDAILSGDSNVKA